MRMDQINNKWIAHSSIKENSKYNLLCFPYAGGSASVYATWGKYIGEDLSLCPVLYPSRERRAKETMPFSLNEIADSFTAECPEVFEQPYILLGHCTGAMTAYEVAKKANELYGRKPSLFIAISAPSPRMKLTDQKLTIFSDDDLLKYMADKQLIDERTLAMKGFLKYYMPIFKGDFMLHDAYDCGQIELMDCDIISMTGVDDKLVEKDKIADWSNFTKGNYEDISFSGDHFFINNHIWDVIDIIKNKLSMGENSNG